MISREVQEEDFAVIDQAGLYPELKLKKIKDLVRLVSFKFSVIF